MKKRDLTFLLTLDKVKIISVNDLYKAKIGYKGGRPFPQIYKNPKSKDIESEIFEQLRALTFDDDQLDLLKSAKNFKITYSFILKSGIGTRDVDNFIKFVQDTFVRFVNKELGITKFDDAQIVELHVLKSIIPKAAHEYIGVSVTRSKHNTRFDQTPEPKNIYLESPEYLKEVKKVVKGQKLKLFTAQDPTGKIEAADTKLYIVTPETPNPVGLVMKALLEASEIIRTGSPEFLWLVFIGASEEKSVVFGQMIDEVNALSGPGRENVEIGYHDSIASWYDSKRKLV